MNKDKLLELFNANRGGYTGAIIGFVLALLLLLFGIWTTLFIALCVGIGYYIGSKISQDKNYITNLLDRILPPGTYR